MSTAWAKGSTRSWRQLRAHVLDRDGWRCKVPVTVATTAYVPEITLCGAFADTAGHITAKVHGGTDTPANLRAECRKHNYADGGRLAHAVRSAVRKWTW